MRSVPHASCPFLATVAIRRGSSSPGLCSQPVAIDQREQTTGRRPRCSGPSAGRPKAGAGRRSFPNRPSSRTEGACVYQPRSVSGARSRFLSVSVSPRFAEVADSCRRHEEISGQEEKRRT
ncbi:hypothetical protein NL676_006122 [Syzygium grande]|nr:hypothetical protein NL676_006122 [Syzygium grande]